MTGNILLIPFQHLFLSFSVVWGPFTHTHFYPVDSSIVSTPIQKTGHSNHQFNSRPNQTISSQIWKSTTLEIGTQVVWAKQYVVVRII